MASWSSGLQPWLRPYAEALHALFPDLTVTSVYRDRRKQARLYANRANNPYPVAPPGKSYHELRRAWDMVGDRKRLIEDGTIWRSWGGTWMEADPIHFQA